MSTSNYGFCLWNYNSFVLAGLLWLEKRKKVTNRIASVLTVASSLGKDTS
jgi:hypothetical protein